MELPPNSNELYRTTPRHTTPLAARPRYGYHTLTRREPRMTPSADQLETFPNPSPGRDYAVAIECP